MLLLLFFYSSAVCSCGGATLAESASLQVMAKAHCKRDCVELCACRPLPTLLQTRFSILACARSLSSHFFRCGNLIFAGTGLSRWRVATRHCPACSLRGRRGVSREVSCRSSLTFCAFFFVVLCGRLALKCLIAFATEHVVQSFCSTIFSYQT